MILRFLAACWLLFASWPAMPAEPAALLVPLPALAERVTDLTGTLAPDRKAALEAATAAIERAKGAQVAVLLLPTTQPESIEQFGIRLAESWRIGRRKVDDGVIIIVAKDDRKMRIEVGYGLEGAIPDAVAKRVVAEVMAPRFKQGDFAGGLDDAVAALGKIIGGEQLPAPAAPATTDVNLDGAPWLLAVMFFSGVLRAALGVVGAMLAAGIAGALAWWIFGSWVAVAIAAVFAFVFSFVRGGGGGLGSGGFSGGGGFSSSSSGGGFSGGGGSFGGGGASGSW
ncbi:MAG TPA: TPM domain-containing protein [Rhodocyclaceae bacterium]|nr:TPM domain-containing protein [Rhodocyclaceae bacterium]